MNTGWNTSHTGWSARVIINLLGNEYWLEHEGASLRPLKHYKPTGK